MLPLGHGGLDLPSVDGQSSQEQNSQCGPCWQAVSEGATPIASQAMLAVAEGVAVSL